jgi:hypothetical protein
MLTHDAKCGNDGTFPSNEWWQGLFDKNELIESAKDIDSLLGTKPNAI